MSKFKVTTGEGQVIEVDQSAIEAPENVIIANTETGIDGYVKQEVMDSTIADRVTKAKNNALKDAHQNEGVRNQVLSQLGIDLDDDGKPKLPKGGDVDLDKEREKWENQFLNPLKQEKEKLENTLGSVTSSVTKQALLGAFAGKAEDVYLDGEYGDPYVVAVLGNQFKYNSELNKVLQVDSEGNFERHPNGSKSNGHGFIEPKDFIELNAESQLMKKILKDNSQGGSGLTPGGGGDKNTLTRKQVDALSPAEAAEFFANGGKVV